MGPSNPSELEVFAIESFRVDVLYQLQKVMNSKNLKYQDLAQRLNMTEGECIHLFTDEADLTVKTLAKICHVLNCKIDFRLVHN